MGPAVDNFDGVVTAFRRARALTLVPDERALGAALEGWLADPLARRELGCRARRVVTANAGATQRLGALLTEEIAALAPRAGAAMVPEEAV